MTQEPSKNIRPWSWGQFAISLGLIALGLITFCLGVEAGFGGKTGIAIIDSAVGDGEAFYGIGLLIVLVGVIWMLALVIRRFLTRILE